MLLTLEVTSMFLTGFCLLNVELSSTRWKVDFRSKTLLLDMQRSVLTGRTCSLALLTGPTCRTHLLVLGSLFLPGAGTTVFVCSRTLQTRTTALSLSV